MAEAKTKSRATTPHSSRKNISVAEYIERQIDLCGKTQGEIAAEVGFNKQNMISMIKLGKAKLPIAKIAPMANALGVDPLYLFQLVMREYHPDTWDAIQEYVFKQPFVTANEMEIINVVRESSVPNPRIRTEAEKIQLLKVISALKSDNATADSD